uniref:Nuclear receptor n=1 Tax=Strongyloides papillosus TaxID=174720 RepID=A0A0N5CF61_STREA
MDSVTKTTAEKCLVCSAPSNAIHFQINSCRACSSFFRRSIHGNKKYRCRRNTKNCIIHFSHKQLCRFCRFRKCIKLGMCIKGKEPETNNTYNNEIILRSSEIEGNKYKENTMDSYDFEKNITRINNESSDRDDSETTVLKYAEKFIDSHILKKNNLKIDGILNLPLQALTHTIKNFLATVNVNLTLETVIVTNAITLKKNIIFIEHCLSTLFKCLLNAPDFSIISLKDKCEICRRKFPIILNLERIYTSLKLFANYTNKNIMLFENTEAFDDINFAYLGDEEVDDSGKDKLFKLFIPCNKFLFQYLYEPMKELSLDDIEFSYLIGSILWKMDNEVNVSQTTKNIANRIIKSFNEELHGYYVFRKKIDNYAHRLSKILNVLSNSEKYILMRNEVFLVARVFDVFDPSNFIEENFKASNQKFFNFFKITLE